MNKLDKTAYFTDRTITKIAKALYAQLDSKIDLHKNQFHPEKSCLLILDMQKFFLSENSHAFVPSGNPLIAPIKSLVEKYIKNNLPIIVTQHINTKSNAKQMDYWWRDIITIDNKLSELIPDIEQMNSELIIKSQYDAFFNTNLDKILNKKNITQIIITGVMTHLCCETTARSAFVRGYTVFFPIDGTATYNLDFHSASLTNLAHGFANIVLINNLLQFFDE